MPGLLSPLRRNSRDIRSASGRTGSRVASVALVALAAAMSLVVLAPSAHADRVINGHLVGGKIEEAYSQTGGFFKWGVPTGPERASAKRGRYQTFSRDASFYWHPAVDGGTAHQVGGAIRARWQKAGAERGALGFPVTNEYKSGSGRSNDFQGGVVTWSKTGGAQVVWGQILRLWQERGGAKGYFGVPLGGEYRIGGRYAQDFLNGTILWP
ncbi:lysozyme [Gordonia jinghuaiqii]|uniref:Lysozyme n=1 Tax=Gordonia jinghuaiqii TaxID=2758710 RepID=A0A7D7QVL9_9ACTN|nr:lysozyme [Gordonia jinghuaiqii]MCR5976708.1 lysozyme [Gordonia jinghuaiqii]QMS99887.1 lysozyme [Gordonia jinghuaiqii]